MATSEAKLETMEDSQLPPGAKVWVLRVSIHCEGCKKKVIKIMNKIKGVYRTEVDMNQHKVTVVGNVEVETLIRSLEKKKGRNWKVELWPQPEKSERREKKQSRSKNREEPQKQQEQEQSKEAPDNADKKPKAALQEKTHLGPPTEADTSSKKSENGGGSNDGEETSENGVKVKETTEEEVKTEAKKGETGPAGILPAEKLGTAAAVEKSENGGGGEDKKMKGQNGNNTNSDNVEEGGGELRASGNSRSRQPPPNRASTDPNPGSSQGRVDNEYPGSFSNPQPHYYMPSHAPPVYTVSYHASYATASGYGSSYYGPSSPGSSYAYMHPGQEIEAYNPNPYVDESSTDVFERFSEENPNACSIM